jgi:hypothetical protein
MRKFKVENPVFWQNEAKFPIDYNGYRAKVFERFVRWRTLRRAHDASVVWDRGPSIWPSSDDPTDRVICGPDHSCCAAKSKYHPRKLVHALAFYFF